MPMQETTQRMPPVDPARRHLARLTQVVLPQFVGKKKCDDQQRQHEKCAQNHSLDHNESPVPTQGISSEREVHSRRMSCAARYPLRSVRESSRIRRLLQAAAFFHATASTPAHISSVPPVRLTARCTDALRIARRAPDASIA